MEGKMKNEFMFKKKFTINYIFACVSYAIFAFIKKLRFLLADGFCMLKRVRF